MTPARKKLIEVALPLKAINEAPAREKGRQEGCEPEKITNFLLAIGLLNGDNVKIHYVRDPDFGDERELCSRRVLALQAEPLADEEDREVIGRRDTASLGHGLATHTT